MPRLTDEAVRQGLLHPDVDVRSAALRYFADPPSPDPLVMPVVIDALDRYGRANTFRFAHPISLLAQSEPTVRWAVGELKTRPRSTEDERTFLDAVARLLVHADPRLVGPHEADILAAPAFDRELQERVRRRQTYLGWDDDALWRELEAVCEQGRSKQYVADMRWADGLDLAEELGRRGDRHAARTMDLLRVEVEDYDDNPLKWMEPLAVRLAGELRLEPAVPLVVRKLHQDVDLMSEEGQTALVRIGTDAVIRAVRDAYPDAPWHFRLYASGVLGRVHTDLAVTTCIELLGQEKDLDLQTWLAQALVEQFSTEGNEAARRAYLDDPDQRDLRNMLVPACTLTGQEFSELDEWRQEMRQERERKPFMFGGPLPPAPVARIPARPEAPAPVLAPAKQFERRVGRNDPCPCGSGKKFKQCCLRK